MSEFTTIARPYAKAVFEHAQSSQQLELWFESLRLLTIALDSKQALAFLHNPNVNDAQRVELFDVIIDKLSLGEEKEKVNNFIKLLAENNRLVVLPEIFAIFDALRSEYEKTLEVSVRTFAPLSEQQIVRLKASLERRLHRNIKLNEVIDQELLGGAIIQAGDLVIDGSVKGKLNKLATDLAA